MPKTKSQNEQIKLERYNAIIDVAVHLFAFKFYGAVSVDEITTISKCSHGLFYHYFKNKEDVFHKMMQRVVNDVESWLSPINLEDQPAKNSLMDLSTMIQKGLESDNDLFPSTIYLLLNLYFKSSLPKPPEREEETSLKRKPLYKIVSYLIQKGQKEGSVIDGDVRQLTIAYLSMIKGLSYNRAVLGRQKFICPNARIIAHTILKEEKDA